MLRHIAKVNNSSVLGNEIREECNKSEGKG